MFLATKLIMLGDVEDRKNVVEWEISHLWLLEFRFLLLLFFFVWFWRCCVTSWAFGTRFVHVRGCRLLQFFDLSRSIYHDILLLLQFLLAHLVLLLDVLVVVGGSKLHRLTVAAFPLVLFSCSPLLSVSISFQFI